MAWGTVTIGGVTLREELGAADDGSLRIAGQEAHPPKTRAHVEAVHHNLVGARGLVLPVVFTDKESLSGFYLVESSSSELVRVHNGAYQTATWQAALERVGTGRDVEFESTVPLIARADTLPGTQTPVFWHAPAIDTTSYLTGVTVPSGFVDRPSEDGIVRVYTGLPTDKPRWTVRADDYLSGAARITVDTFRRLGLVTPSAALWELSNGLVRVTPGPSGGVTVSCWDNGQWRSANSFVFLTGFAYPAGGAAPEMTVLRNDPEAVSVRLTYPTTDGRVTVDLGLRRGARFVTGVMKRHSAAPLSVVREPQAATTTPTGGVRQTTADVDGNRFVVGSATADHWQTDGHLFISTATRLDFFIGHEVSPVAAGDAFADLLAQYLGGAAGERVRIVRR